LDLRGAHKQKGRIVLQWLQLFRSSRGLLVESQNINKESMETFSWPVRVYYEDTDSGGVVYYANYLRFMERARTEWLRDLGIEQDVVREQDGIIFAVTHASIDYIKPARFNDSLIVLVKPVTCGRASLVFDQQVLRLDADGQTELCRGQIKIACLDAEKMRPRPIPKYIQAEIRR
jgi:acyl-CoA thioester hydrolase